MEDAVTGSFPRQIKGTERRIAAYEQDIQTAKSNQTYDADNKLVCGIELNGIHYDKREDAGKALLGLIGANMVRESREHDDESVSDSFRFMTMLPLAVATSIDALAVGVTFAFLQVDIVPAVSFIGATTFVLSCIGVKIGHVFGTKYKSRAELFGGIVLILMGLKILLEHLGFLG